LKNRIITCIDVWRSVIKVLGWSNFPELRDVNYNADLLAARGILILIMYMCTNVYLNLILHSFHQCTPFYHRDIRQQEPEPSVSQLVVFLTADQKVSGSIPTRAKAK
jgi:hypothetical protein